MMTMTCEYILQSTCHRLRAGNGGAVWRCWSARAAQAVAAAALLLLLLSGWASQAWAAPFTGSDAKLVRQVVKAQLAALAADDAVKAFSYAAPNVRQAVGSPARFMALVQRGYPMVYRPASVAFLRPNGKNNDVIQRVQISDADGELWLATYRLQRQKNKSWRITGCSVVENKGRIA